jgi:GTP cyclohydrolase II
MAASGIPGGTRGARSMGAPVAPGFLTRLAAQRPRADVQRAIAELYAGRPVIVTDRDHAPRLAMPIDGLTPAILDDLRGIAAGPLELVVSATRAARLGAEGMRSATMRLPASVTDRRILELVAGAEVGECGPLARGDHVCDAAIELAKLARLLPAVLSMPVPEGALAKDLLQVRAIDALAFRDGQADTLRRVSSAPVPMRAALDCELTVFRDELGESWSMIRVGLPDTRATVPVRLHSACLTGDAFASLRCDCGDQLQMALATIDALGGGLLLYLTQEGCGIGLANKMRAYRLQDEGLDTIDANTTLGFERDERRYEAAAQMLRSAGFERVALLTNNPSKVDALRAAGIDVRERIPLLAPVRGGNRRYLETKSRRAGHLIGDTTVPGT